MSNSLADPKNNQTHQGRFQWVDYARGIGIFLVVVGHTERGLVNADILPESEIVKAVDTWIYAFHMPLFFFLSGLFATRGAAKGVKVFFRDKIQTIVYPYFVWSILQGLMKMSLAKSTNNPMSWNKLFGIVVYPIEQFWFLYALFLISLIFIVLHLLGIRRWLLLILAIILRVVVAVYGLGPWGPLNQAGVNFLYFALGAFLGPTNLFSSKKFNTLLLSVSAVTLYTLIAIFTILYPGSVISSLLVKSNYDLLLALGGIVATLCLSELLTRKSILKQLPWWGRQSLVLFVAHSVCSAGFRIILHKGCHVTSIPIHLVGGIIVGLYGPLLLQRLADIIHFPYLFSWPRVKVENPSIPDRDKPVNC